MFTALLQFADSGEIELPVAREQTVVDAAMAADIPLRFDCNVGACGACVAHLLVGETAVLDGASPLTGDELLLGLRATCRTRLLSDARFELPYALSSPATAPERAQARVVEVGRIAASVHRLVLELERPAAFSFESGQYVRLRPPGFKIGRAFSIAGALTDLPRLEFLIRHVPGGEMTSWLTERAEAGVRIGLFGPLGSFGLHSMARRHLFVPGGTGLAPVLSMLRALPRDSSALLCFGCNAHEEVFYADELHALASAHPDMEIRIGVAKGERGSHLSGNAVSLVRRDDFAQDATVYLCGPPAMVTAARLRLQDWGVAHHRIRTERYQPTS